MTLWSEQLEIVGQRVHLLPLARKILFAIACVDHAASRLLPEFKGSQIGSSGIEAFADGFDMMWVVALAGCNQPDKRLSEMANQIEAFVPDDGSPEMAVHGWSNLINSLIYAMVAESKKDADAYALAAAEYAYQAVFEARIFPRIDREMLGDEVKAMEAADSVCMDEIAFQRQCLSSIEQGTIPTRLCRH